MAEPLLHYGPETMGDDERFIAKGYQPEWWYLIARIGILGATAYSADVKWVTAVGFVLVLETVRGLDGRFVDICTRLRRTNKLLSESR